MAQKTETGGTDAPVSYSIDWTPYNYPASITGTLEDGESESVAFNYGSARQRWRMVYTQGSANETTEYIGALMQKVTSSIGSTEYRYYIDGEDGLTAIQSVDSSGTPTTHYVLKNQEHSISHLLNSDGSVAANESFTAYGNRRNASTWSGPPSSSAEATMDAITRRGFTGQTVLGQLGLNDMNGRVEDAVTGTFLSPDPHITHPANTQDYYRYVYVYNNPLKYVDPTGFQRQFCFSVGSGQNSFAPVSSTKAGFGAYVNAGNPTQICQTIPKIHVPPPIPTLQPVIVPGNGPPPNLPRVIIAGPTFSNLSGGLDRVSAIQSAGSTQSGGIAGSGPQSNQRQRQCTAAQQQAAQLASQFESLSKFSDLFALGSGLGTLLAGAGEGVTFGADTPITITFGSAATFFGGRRLLRPLPHLL